MIYDRKQYEKGYSDGYNKAIDDFVEKVKLKYIGVHPDELYEKYYPREICEKIKELAEQLKESCNKWNDKVEEATITQNREEEE